MATRTLLFAVAGLLMLPTTSMNAEHSFCSRNPGTCRAPNELAAEIAMKARSAVQILQKATAIVAVVAANSEQPAVHQREFTRDTLSSPDREVPWSAPEYSQRGE